MPTDAQLRALVDANAPLRLLVRGNATTPTRDVEAAALATTLLPKEVTEGSRYTELGIIAAFADPAAGETVLQTLETLAETNPLLSRMLRWVAPGAPGLDFGNAALRAAISAYHTAGHLTTLQRDTLLSLGERTPVVTTDMIARAR